MNSLKIKVIKLTRINYQNKKLFQSNNWKIHSLKILWNLNNSLYYGLIKLSLNKGKNEESIMKGKSNNKREKGLNKWNQNLKLNSQFNPLNKRNHNQLKYNKRNNQQHCNKIHHYSHKKIKYQCNPQNKITRRLVYSALTKHHK